MKRSFAVWVWLAVVTFAVPSHAQQAAPSPAEVLLARDLFHEGVEAMRSSNWPAAISAFTRSYALYPQPMTLLNLAGAQVQSGRLVEGAESYRQVLRGEAQPALEPYLASARDAMTHAEERIAHLRITVEHLSAHDSVLLDDQPLSSAALDALLPINPGPHSVRVLRGGTESIRREVVIGEHATEVIELSADGGSTAGVATGARVFHEPTPSTPSQGGILRSPIFWTIAAVVVVGGAATAIGVGVSSSAQPAHYVGSLMPGTITVY